MSLGKVNANENHLAGFVLAFNPCRSLGRCPSVGEPTEKNLPAAICAFHVQRTTCGTQHPGAINVDDGIKILN
jgi:hypothetical protein